MELSSEYNIIPVYREYMADTETPTSIFLKCCGLDSEGFILESIEGTKNLSRYSFIGIGFSGRALLERGIFKYEEKGRRLKTVKTRTPLTELENIMDRFNLYKDPALEHFIGGAVGYLSYDLVNYFDHIPLPEARAGFPEMFLYFTDMVVVFDHLMNRLKIISTLKTGNLLKPGDAYDLSVEKINELEKKIASNAMPSLSKGLNEQNIAIQSRNQFKSNFDPQVFKEAVEKARERIIEGDAFQIVISQRLTMQNDRDPINIYRG